MIKKNQKGFTIIELIVVIAIIALLSGIVATNVTKYINKSKQARVKTEFANFEKALTAFYEKYNNYPEGMFYPESQYYGAAPCLEDDTGIHCLSEFYNIDWTNENATYYPKGQDASHNPYYELDLWDVDRDGKTGCAFLYLCTEGSWGVCYAYPAYKFILCQDCPNNCGDEWYEWE